VVLGAVFTWLSVVLVRSPSTRSAMRLFAYSITYITLLFGAMALDELVRAPH
jgi:protoheme IX farnesyltransferase